MIKNISKTKKGDLLEVFVECRSRKYIKQKVREITTEDVIKEIKEEYGPLSLVSEPQLPVGNSIGRNINTSGTWIFELEKNKRKKVQNKRKNPSTKSSVRARISKIVAKDKQSSNEDE